jgi:8-amino-7-oxononanoate synthase
MPPTHHLPGRTVIAEGKERLYFSGTSYLGINHQPGYRELLQEGIQQYGGNYSSSRASNLQLEIYEEAETFLAQWVGVESVLTFSSGFQAGQALMSILPPGVSYIFAPGSHPAVWQRDQEVWQGDFPSWVLSLTSQIAVTNADEIVIVTNSLDPLYAVRYKFNWLSDLPTDRHIHVIVDDSHGLGVLGKDGEGIISEIRNYMPGHVQLTIVGSIGKALGVPGGLVAGSESLIQKLKQSPSFTAASPISPAYLYTFLHAQTVYREARKKLKDRVQQFQLAVDSMGLFRFFGHYPVFYTPYNELADMLADTMLLSSFPYPHPDSEPVTRLVLNALHTEEDIFHLIKAIKHYTYARSPS